jgi:hypothetical protein
MKRKITLSVIGAVAGILMAVVVRAEQPVSGGIEVYAAGKHFASADEYRLNKISRALSTKEAAMQKDLSSQEPFMGKTLVIHPDGKVEAQVASGNSLKAARGQARVMGINPSFRKISEDFDAGTMAGGVLPQRVTRAQLNDDLRARLGMNDKPVLMLRDKDKLKVMELKEVARSEVAP